MPSDKELKFAAVMYASRPGVLEHVRRTGELPTEIPMGGASIQANHLLRTRGAEPELTEDERLVYEAIRRSGQLPGGQVIPLSEQCSAASTQSNEDAPVEREQKPSTMTKKLYYREAWNESLVFAPPEEALRIHQIHHALTTATTWGEFRDLMPATDYEELIERMSENLDEGEEPFSSDDEGFQSDRVWGYADGDYPDWLQAQAESFLPAEILAKYAHRETTVLNGDFWRIDPANEAAVVAELQQRGFVVEHKSELRFY